MPTAKRPLAIFWLAVTVDVIALGFAWSAWKAFDTNRLAILVAAPASGVCVVATLVAGRILAVISRKHAVPRELAVEEAKNVATVEPLRPTPMRNRL